LLKQLGRHGAPWVEGVLFSLAVDSGALVPNMRRAMHISAESAARSREEIDAIFDEVSATLEGKVRDPCSICAGSVHYGTGSVQYG
jgi:hypothetical protein